MGTAANSGYRLGGISCTNVTTHLQAVPSELGVWALVTPALYAPCVHRTYDSPRECKENPENPLSGFFLSFFLFFF